MQDSNIWGNAAKHRGMRFGLRLSGGQVSKLKKKITGVILSTDNKSTDALLTNITLVKSKEHAGYELEHQCWRYFYLRLTLKIVEMKALETMLKNMRPSSFK